MLHRESHRCPSSSVNIESLGPTGLQNRHVQRLIEFNKDMFQRNVLTDVECVVQGHGFKAHRSLLICFSPYLKRKLINIEGQPTYNKIHIPKIGLKEFEILLRYMYTGNMDIDCNSFLVVYKAACFLEIQEAMQECLKLIADLKDEIRSYFYTYVLSKQLGVQENWQKALKLLAHRFEETVFSKECMTLELNYVIEILSAQTIGARSEVIVFLAALNWLNYDYLNRNIHAVTVMKCVRFSCMSMEEILACYHPPFLSQVVHIPEITMILYRATCYIAAKSQGQEYWFKQFANPKRNLTFDNLPMELWHKISSPPMSTVAGSHWAVNIDTSNENLDGAEQWITTSLTRRFKSPTEVTPGNFDDKNKHWERRTYLETGKDSDPTLDGAAASQFNPELRNLPNLDDLYKEMGSDDESCLDEIELDDEVAFPEKSEMIRGILKNRQFETSKRIPAETSKKIPDSSDFPSENLKIIHRLSKGPKPFYGDTKSKQEKKNSPKDKKPAEVENIPEDTAMTNEFNQLILEQDINSDDMKHISLSLKKCPHESECKAIKGVTVNVNIPPKADYKPTVYKHEDARDNQNLYPKDPAFMDQIPSPKDQAFMDQILSPKERAFMDQIPSPKEPAFEDQITSLKEPAFIDQIPTPKEPAFTNQNLHPKGSSFTNQKLTSSELALTNQNLFSSEPSFPYQNLSSSETEFTNQKLPPMEIAEERLVSNVKHTKTEGCILVVGGMNPKNLKVETGSAVRILNLATNKEKHYTNIPESRHNHCTERIDDFLYVVGGCNTLDTIEKSRYVATRSCFRLNLKTTKWSTLPNMQSSRCDHGLILYDGRLYAVGGQDQNGKLVRTLEVYDPKRNRWTLLNSSLCCGRKAMGITVFNDRIWVVGGLIQSEKRGQLQAVSIVDLYDLKEKKWDFNLFPLPQACCFCSLAAWDKKLYCIGGMIQTSDDKTRPTDEVWIVDTTDKLWKKGPSLPEPRLGGVAITYGENLYYLGGFDPDSRTDSDKVLFLTPGAAFWNFGPSLTSQLFGLSAVSYSVN